MTSTVAATLSPSELVLLQGAIFAGKPSFMDKTKLLDRTTDVSLTGLSRVLMSVALLANEQVGALRLEARSKKALFGLRTVESLYVVPVNTAAEWPADSLEAQVLATVATFGGRQPEVSDVFYTLLQEDSSNPRHDVVQRANAGLVARELVNVVTEKKLKVFSVSQLELPESTAALAAQLPAAPVQELLEACERSRPQIWKLLGDHIKSAISRRTEQSDSGGFSSSD